MTILDANDSSDFFLAPLEDIPYLKFSGTERTMGQQFGESCRSVIQDFYKCRLTTAIEHGLLNDRHLKESDFIASAHESLKYLQQFDEKVFQEFSGIAEGALLSPEKLYLLQGLTDLRDWMTWGRLEEACTSILLDGERTQSRQNILAQNWDLQTNNMPFVCAVERRPSDAPATISLTTVGCLSLVGLNEEGLALGTNNIKTKDSQVGVHYLALIHRALREKNAKSARKIIKNSRRAGAHFYLIADKYGENIGLETSALSVRELEKDNGFIGHANHVLDKELRELEAQGVSDSSCARQERIKEIIDNLDNISKSDIRRALSDLENGENSINRYGVEMSTNGSAIIYPQNGEIHCCRSQPDRGHWQTFSF